MEDITGLSGKEFSDQFDLVPVQKPAPSEPTSTRPNLIKKNYPFTEKIWGSRRYS